MNLQEVFDQLTYGELGQLSIGGGDAGVIDQSNYARVIAHINLGLAALFKRFNLKEGRVRLQLQTGQVVYPISSDYAVSNTRSRAPVRYLLDSRDAPFSDDILKIERVLTEDGFEMVLNDGANADSVSTPSALTLRVPKHLVTDGADLPEHLNTEYLDLVYRAAHAKLVVPIGYFDPSRVSLELPDSHLEALLLFVASRVNAPVGMVNEFNASNNYYSKYEAACQALEGEGLQIDKGSQYDRLYRNGWV